MPFLAHPCWKVFVSLKDSGKGSSSEKEGSMGVPTIMKEYIEGMSNFVKFFYNPTSITKDCSDYW